MYIRNLHLSPYLLLTLTTLFWSGNFVLARYLRLDIPPIGLSFWRWALAGLILLPFVRQLLVENWPLVRQHLLLVVTLSMLGVASFNTLIYLGLQTTTASNAVLMQSFIPVAIIGLSYLILGSLIILRQTVGIFISLLGVSFIITQGELAALLKLDLNRGDLLVLVAVLAWGIYSVLLKKLPQDLKGLVLLGYTIYFGIVGIAPIYAWEIFDGRTLSMNLTTAGALAYVAIFPSIIAYLFWNRAVSQVGPAKAGQFMHLMPVFGTILSMIFLGERLQWYHVTGILLVAVGIYLATLLKLR